MLIIIILKGISNSPVNAMHAGYGIGAIIVVQTLKSYIKFDPLLKTIEKLNDSTVINITKTDKNLTSSDIDLFIPYTYGACYGIFIVIAFLFAQYFESKVLKSNSKDVIENLIEKSSPVSFDHRANLKSIQKNSFGSNLENETSTCAVIVITTLLFFLFMFVNGTITIVNTFMLTYMVNGPAKFDVFTFIQLQTLYWLFQIISRISAALCGFKMNSLIFFLILILTQFFITIFYSIPILNTNKMFYWILIPLLGFGLGPMIPSCFMITKYLYKNINAFLLSILLLGTGIGNIFSQYITGFILDKFDVNNYPFFSHYYTSSPVTSKYLIPFIILFFISVSTIIFTLILIIYKCNRKNVLKK